MITLVQAKKTSDAITHFKPQVAVTWLTDNGKCVDGFSRDFCHNFPQFDMATSKMPDNGRSRVMGRYAEGEMSCHVDDRIYVVGVIGHISGLSNRVNSNIIIHILENVAAAMRKDGLTSIVLPMISPRRNPDMRTCPYLDLIDRVFPDMDVYVATPVALQNHGRAYVDITTRFSMKEPTYNRPSSSPMRIFGSTDGGSPYGAHFVV